MRSWLLAPTTLACLCCIAALPACPAPDDASVVAADERCSLGTIQEGGVLELIPGGEASTTIGFYNVDGTVPVTVELELVDVPGGWSATLEPRCRDGMPSASSESDCRLRFRIDPMPLSPERPVCEGACEKSYWLQDRGYVCARAVDVCITAPADVSTGATLRLSVVGTCDSASGLMPQERELAYEVVMVPAAKHSSRLVPAGVAIVGALLLGLMLRRIAKSHML